MNIRGCLQCLTSSRACIQYARGRGSEVLVRLIDIKMLISFISEFGVFWLIPALLFGFFAQVLPHSLLTSSYIIIKMNMMLASSDPKAVNMSFFAVLLSGLNVSKTIKELTLLTHFILLF